MSAGGKYFAQGQVKRILNIFVMNVFCKYIHGNVVECKGTWPEGHAHIVLNAEKR